MKALLYTEYMHKYTVILGNNQNESVCKPAWLSDISQESVCNRFRTMYKDFHGLLVTKIDLRRSERGTHDPLTFSGMCGRSPIGIYWLLSISWESYIL